MPVRNLRTIPIYVFIPPAYSPVYKIIIECTDGTELDITDIIHEGMYTDGVTDTIGNFSFIFDNSNETYYNKVDLYNKLKIYMDYATTATTLRFVGMIEKSSYGSNTIRITGRSSSARVMGITVTKTYTDQYTHTIIEDLIDTYADGIITRTGMYTPTLPNLDTTEGTDTQISVNWSQKPFWECILELCSRAGYDAYIDQDFDFNYFVSNSRGNSTECIVHSQNLIETGEFAPDLTQVKNRIILYGGTIQDMQIIWTAEDTDSIAKYDLKEEVINDSSITSVTNASARAAYELSIKKEPPIVGTITSLGLPTLLPGERLRISDPMNGIQPSYYTINNFTHEFSNDDPLKTTVTVQKEITTIPKILKKRLVFETEAMDMNNPNSMKYSWIFDFNSDSGTHDNTVITESYLKLPTGETSGVWTSPTITSLNSVSSFEVRIKGDNYLEDVRVYISIDGGSTWTYAPLNTVITVTAGVFIGVRVNIDSADSDTKIDSLMVLYK